MALIRLQDLITCIRHIRAENAKSDADPDLLAANLVHSAAVIAGLVHGTEAGNRLMKKACEYQALIEGKHFQEMCRLAGYLVTELRLATGRTGERLAAAFADNGHEAQTWLESLNQAFDLPTPVDSKPYRYSSLLGWGSDAGNEEIDSAVFEIVAPSQPCMPGYTITMLVYRLERVLGDVLSSARLFCITLNPRALQLTRDLRRLCAYLYELAQRTAFSGSRGSFWIAASAGWLQRPASAPMTVSPRACLAVHLTDSINAILIAAEFLVESLQEAQRGETDKTESNRTAGGPALSQTPAQVASQPEADAALQANEARGTGADPAAVVPADLTTICDDHPLPIEALDTAITETSYIADACPATSPYPVNESGGPASAGGPRVDGASTAAEKPTNRSSKRSKPRKKRAWHSVKEHRPDGFHGEELCGARWQVAWALALAGITTKSSIKTMEHKLRKGRIIWGREDADKGLYRVCIAESYSREQVTAALARLQEIRDRGPFRPKGHPLPKPYKSPSGSQSHRKSLYPPLSSKDQRQLAQVLFEAGCLDCADTEALHDKLNDGGEFFGVFRDGTYTLYMSERIADKVDHLHAILNEKQQGQST